MRALRLMGCAIVVAGCLARTAPRPATPRAEHRTLDGAELTKSRGSLPPGAYNLGQLPVLGMVLSYVQQDYFDKRRINFKNMAKGALDFVQRDVPEVVVTPVPGRDQVRVSVAGSRAVFSLERLDSFGSLYSALQPIFRWVQLNLPRVSPEAEGPRLLAVETAAVNGMLYTLDPHSMLLDPRIYGATWAQPGDDRSASIGLIVAIDATDRLAVTDVVPNSPAGRAEIAPGDRIARIDDADTRAMTLDEVVERLRGRAGTKVELVLEREGQREPRRRTLTRTDIYLSSIVPAPRLLSDKVGYFRLSRLGKGAGEEVDQALRAFNRERASAVIMDLRGNQGGLYDEARKVIDEFVDEGTIVSMVGAGGAFRKDETATASSPATQLPLVVLVDHETASGGEVVAAALQSLDRGVVVGEATFGAGSVQVLFDIPSPLAAPGSGEGREGKLGLRLTTAQMLAAGSVPVQDWGVVPDVPAQALSVATPGTPDLMRLEPTRHVRREVDYEWALPPPPSPPLAAPSEVLRYLRQREDARLRPGAPESDPLVALAQGLLRQKKAFLRHELLATANPFLTVWLAEQDRKLIAAMNALGIDWSAGPSSARPALQLTLERMRSTEGGPVVIRGVVKNIGPEPAFRVRAVIESDDPSFDEAELPFGKVGPGQSRSYDLRIDPRTNRDRPWRTRSALLKATLVAEGHRGPGAAELLVELQGPPPATLAFRYQVREAPEASNHDGRIERGESVEIPVTVINRGTAPVTRLRLGMVTPQLGERIAVPAGRFEADELAPGASTTFPFVISVPASFGPDQCDLKLELQSGETIDYPIRIALTKTDGATPVSAGVAAAVEVEPPRLTVRGPAVTQHDSVHVEGTASGHRPLLDVYIRVWNEDRKIPVQKVFYQRNRLTTEEMSFETDVPVAPGMNLIQVFARESPDVAATQTLMVFKRSPASSAVRH